MGMAASQARLLTLTARLADNELRSQTINNAKMRLATQSAQASDNYINALNNAELMFSNYDETGMEQSQLLTFNALTSYSSYNNQYGLVNAAGQLLVSEAEARMFEKANGNLNNYLKDHGLVYDTTYFDKLTPIDNKGIYPDPYNTISNATLKSWYEAYGSMENSNENVLYGQKYDDYTMSLNSLKKVLNPAFQNYLKNNTSGTINTSTDPVSLKGISELFVSVDDKIEKLNNAFTNVNPDYLTKEAKNALNTILSSVEKIDDSTVKVKDAPQPVVIDETAKTIEIQGRKWTYSDSAGAYNIVSCPAEEKDEHTNVVDTVFPVPTPVPPATSFSSLKNLIDSLSIQYIEFDDDGNEISRLTNYYEYNETDNGIKTVTPYIKTTAVNEVLNDALASAYALLTSSDSINVDKIIDALENPLNNDFDRTTEYEGKQLSAYANEYINNRNDFLGFIFAEGVDDVKNLLKSGKIQAKDLTDPDYILKLLNGKITITDSDGNSNIVIQPGVLKLTNEYNTIVQDMFVAKMIEETGEPKYAWIDQNDTTNKGNADAKAQWYTNLFNRMKDGFKAIENGLASSSEWLEFALESGLVSMEQVDKNFNWKSLDYKTCAKITEQTDNSAAVAKAEAEYTRAMNDIDAKDSMYDMQLKNIDTEHSALQTEYESIKNVLNKNIERTFKFSQNG